jgi:type IV pilus assembly protein PilW
MVEIMVTTVVFGIVVVVLNTLFFSSNKVYTRTNQRVGLQASSRTAMSIMTTEIRQAGCDPMSVGLSGVMRATADSLRVRADTNGDGAISVVEPSEDIVYFYDADAQTLNRDPGTGAAVIVANVTSAGFSYLDGANNTLGPLPLDSNQAERVRTIVISLTQVSADAGDVSFATSIALRNQ